MKIVICGSMKFSAEMLAAQEELNTRGHEVCVPIDIAEYALNNIVETAQRKIEHDYIKHYHAKISEGDVILVMNISKNGIENYIGGNTLMELGFAHVMNKKIYLFNPIPVMSYSDEIVAVQPIVLNGDLSLL